MTQRDQLILRYAPLVRYAIGSLTRSTSALLDAEDLYSYGTMGLIEAIDRFDASRGVKFETYALARIRGYLLDQLRALDWLPRSTRARARVVERTSARLEEQLGRLPDRQELAAETGLTPDACERLLAYAHRSMLSLDRLVASSAEEPQVALLQCLADEQSANPVLATEHEELRRGLAAALAQLPERERAVLVLRYKHRWTFSRIARSMGLSESRASQLHGQAIARMRRSLSTLLGDLQPGPCSLRN
ncbi:MAG TPA: FliA/WhiG family RNA polymerase sigma factor [Chloroflexota bacterium]|nr:FliA/WhiG family RNA polymerase sigma factor [Chloroflexota bacterium]